MKAAADAFISDVSKIIEAGGYGPVEWQFPLNQHCVIGTIRTNRVTAHITASGRDLVECKDMIDVLAQARAANALKAIKEWSDNVTP